MRYVGAFGAALVAAVTISLTLLCQATRAADDKFTVESMIGRNSLLPPSASSRGQSIFFIERYVNPPTLLQALALVNVFTCTEAVGGEGSWTHTATADCGKDASGNVLKCGTVTTGTITAPLANGFCPGKTFTFAAIYYEWIAHNNQSNASPSPIPLNSVADIFNANWTSPGGGASPVRFHIFVPVVRPDHETTAFLGWWSDNPTVGEWQQTLIPPSSDPNFDFSGETVKEEVGGAGEDTCWSPKSPFPQAVAVTGAIWPVQPGNVWGPDQVGWFPDAVTYYRNPTPPPPPAPPDPPPPSPVPCGFTFQQQMTIRAPSDGTTFNKYGAVNVLRGEIKRKKVSSERAGKSKKEKWP